MTQVPISESGLPAISNTQNWQRLTAFTKQRASRSTLSEAVATASAGLR